MHVAFAEEKTESIPHAKGISGHCVLISLATRQTIRWAVTHLDGFVASIRGSLSAFGCGGRALVFPLDTICQRRVSHVNAVLTKQIERFAGGTSRRAPGARPFSGEYSGNR
jgi:hypothetical protein